MNVPLTPVINCSRHVSGAQLHIRAAMPTWRHTIYLCTDAVPGRPRVFFNKSVAAIAVTLLGSLNTAHPSTSVDGPVQVLACHNLQ